MIDRISYSGLKTYLSCPLLFFYRYILNLELPQKSIDLHFGKCIHKALELYHKENKDVLETFKKEFTSDRISNDELSTYWKFLELGPKLLTYYLRKGKLDKKIIATEKKLTFSDVLDPSTNVRLAFKEITGVVDFETEDEYLGDYKTSSHKYSSEEVEQSLQPTMYYLLYYLENKKWPKGFIYQVFLKKRKKDLMQLVETQRTKEQVTGLVLLLNDIYAKIEKKEFNRTHNENRFPKCDCYEFEKLLKIN